MKHTIKRREMIISLALVCFGLAGSCLADTIYFKNGRKMEGEVKRTPEGLWIEGGLFQENEIDRVEKGPAPDQKKENQPWYSGVLNKFGIQSAAQTPQNQSTRPAPAVQRQAQQKAVVPVPAGQQPSRMPLALPFPFAAPQAQQGAGQQDFSAMIQQAQQLQVQAQQQQHMMMQEMMKAEEGYYEESFPAAGTSGGRGSSSGEDIYQYSPPAYQGKSQSGSGYGGYDSGTPKKSGGKKFKTMDIDEYGNVSWE